MSGPIFVCDAQRKPLMPMSAAHARKLLRRGKAQRIPHHAFTIIQLTQTREIPSLRPVVLGITIHPRTAELFLMVDGVQSPQPLLHIVVDLRTDLPFRLRRRAGHRRRRRGRGRYRAPQRYGVPFKLRRLSLAQSHWGGQLRRRTKAIKRTSLPPTIVWRVQAIERVILQIQKLVPLSHVLLISPPSMPGKTFRPLRPSEHRQLLLDIDPRCIYCGDTLTPLVRDHVVPRGQGGTEAWKNMVLACTSCNARKGNRTPQQADMAYKETTYAKRASPYVRQTAQGLMEKASRWNLVSRWLRPSNSSGSGLPEGLFEALMKFKAHPTTAAASFLAKPVSRFRKQIFTAHNYPLTTAIKPPFERVGSTVKRRIRVNKGLAIEVKAGKPHYRVVQAVESVPSETYKLITAGMLVEGQRVGKKIIGIIGAVHSTGKLTLLVPEVIKAEGVTWQRIVISPRVYLNLKSTDRVLFLPISTALASDAAEEGVSQDHP